MRHSRREFLTATSVAAAFGAFPSAFAQTRQRDARPRLRIQVTTGNYGTPISKEFYTLYEEPSFRELFDTTILPWPNPFRNINGSPGQAGPEVVLLADFVQKGWPEADREPWPQYLDAGKGLVMLHHACLTNEGWEWWRKSVSGLVGRVVRPESKTTANQKHFPRANIRPVGTHPIVRDVKPFRLMWDELWPNLQLEPNVTPLLESDDPHLVSPTVAWLGLHPKGRVVCLAPGHTPFALSDLRYQHILRNIILWAGGRLA
jgi:hypothetical protein